MFGHAGVKRRGKDEAEKPFWISFADLMSALMVLFLVVMSSAMLSVTKTISDQEQAQNQRNIDIEHILDGFEQAAEQFEGIGHTEIGGSFSEARCSSISRARC